eukprot:6534696-Prymnesium_polylepis.1
MSEAPACRRRAAIQWICVLPASVEQLRHGSPAELYGPSRLCMRHSGGLFSGASVTRLAPFSSAVRIFSS